VPPVEGSPIVETTDPVLAFWFVSPALYKKRKVEKNNKKHDILMRIIKTKQKKVEKECCSSHRNGG
jgi:hypothetical protein